VMGHDPHAATPVAARDDDYDHNDDTLLVRVPYMRTRAAHTPAHTHTRRDTRTHTHTHLHTHAHTRAHAHTHTHAHARAHARTHTHAHTHTLRARIRFAAHCKVDEIEVGDGDMRLAVLERVASELVVLRSHVARAQGTVALCSGTVLCGCLCGALCRVPARDVLRATHAM
jgi:hypothetical protein